MARCQVFLVRQDAGVEADHDADVLPQVLVALGGKFWSPTGGGEAMDSKLIRVLVMK